MNWSRAKTILIVTFLVLDLFLVSQLIGQHETYIPASEYQAVNESTLDLLQNKYQIKVDIKGLPLGLPPKSIPEVGWQQVDGNVIGQALWPNQEVDVSQKGIYNFEDELLIIEDYMFYYSSDRVNERVLAEEELITKHFPLALENISHIDLIATTLKLNLEQALGLEFSNWNVEDIILVEGDQTFYEVNFVQDIGLPVYDAGSYTKVKLDLQGRIIEMKRAALVDKNTNKSIIEWIKEKITITRQTKIISAAEALLSFAGQSLGEEGSIIKDIKLAYYGLKESNLVQDGSTPSKWQLMPVWRIRVEKVDGKMQNYFLNAYTGKQE